ncbi:MAG: hypothetical protein Q7R60_02460 [bacterium]|nr:hypothetical protein [bacterium]
MPRITKIEQAIRGTGAVQYGEFTAHNGEQGDCKVVLDDLLDYGNDQHAVLRNKVEDLLVRKLTPFEPEILIPMPEGANSLGLALARKLGARAILLEWEDKEAGILKFKDQHERIVVCLANRAALIDDVKRRESTFEQAIESIGLGSKDLVSAVVWDRSDPKHPSSLGITGVSVVKKYIPMWVELGLDSR